MKHGNTFKKVTAYTVIEYLPSGKSHNIATFKKRENAILRMNREILFNQDQAMIGCEPIKDYCVLELTRTVLC